MHLAPETFDALRRLIHSLCGVALTPDKAYLVRHRLEPVMQTAGLTSYEDLAAGLSRGDPALAAAVVAAITTQETSFFRDAHPFEALRTRILPERQAQAAAAKRPLRLWSAATATGQEAYTLAMLVAEAGGDRSGAKACEIVATDISAEALQAAEKAEYARRDVARGLSAAQLARFFDVCPAGYQVRPVLRRLITFRQLNLVDPFESLGTFDVVLCRNVLIYFDEPTRRSVVERIRGRLAPGGWLILGAAENLYGISETFESVRVGQTLAYRT
ncbi:MAG: protein-glutamate O-methyltransferase CheR [Pirellulales bacterium]